MKKTITIIAATLLLVGCSRNEKAIKEYMLDRYNLEVEVLSATSPDSMSCPTNFLLSMRNMISFETTKFSSLYNDAYDDKARLDSIGNAFDSLTRFIDTMMIAKEFNIRHPAMDPKERLGTKAKIKILSTGEIFDDYFFYEPEIKQIATDQMGMLKELKEVLNAENRLYRVREEVRLRYYQLP